MGTPSFVCGDSEKVVPMSAFSTLSHWFITIIPYFSSQKPSKNPKKERNRFSVEKKKKDNNRALSSNLKEFSEK